MYSNRVLVLFNTVDKFMLTAIPEHLRMLSYCIFGYQMDSDGYLPVTNVPYSGGYMSWSVGRTGVTKISAKCLM